MSTQTAIDERFERIKRAKRRVWIGAGVVFSVIMVFFYIALDAVDFSLGTIYEYAPTFYSALVDGYLPGFPLVDVSQYWEFIYGDAEPVAVPLPGTFALETPFAMPELFGDAGITLAIGFAGTVIGFPLALLFGVLGSERVIPFPFNFIFRGTMSCIRAIPALVWVLIYVPLGGVTPFTATLAVATDTVGNLGRLFTDELEEIEDGPIEAIETTGADKPQTVMFGMLSQVYTPFIAWTLYIFEINVRIAVGLGIIGGGGIGWVLDNQRRLFEYTNMMATIIVILVLIISVEMFSQRLRSHIRADEEPMSLYELITGFPRRMLESFAK